MRLLPVPMGTDPAVDLQRETTAVIRRIPMHWATGPACNTMDQIRSCMARKSPPRTEPTRERVLRQVVLVLCMPTVAHEAWLCMTVTKWPGWVSRTRTWAARVVSGACSVVEHSGSVAGRDEFSYMMHALMSMIFIFSVCITGSL